MSGIDELISKLKTGDIESSLIIALTSEGERIFLHHFQEEIHALEFLEMMVAGFRADILEKLMRRQMN